MTDYNQAKSHCALCSQSTELRVSHILPAFVFRWLRETSATGHIRSIANIDRRVQDGEKKPWLCGECEQIFSREEQAFSSRLFYPWLAGASSVEYEAWLMRFCTSVSWRVLNHCKGSNPNHQYTADENKKAALASKTWRDYLLGNRKTVGRFEQHLLPLDIIEDTTVPNLPENINRFLTRNVEMDVVGGAGIFMTYAKLGGFAIFGMIQPPRRWVGTRVYGERGRIEPRKYVLPGALMHFFMDRARASADALAEMSATQVAKVDHSVLSDIDRVTNSPQMRAMLADARMFGEQAIVRK